MKIAFDVGGVLSKFPSMFRELFYALDQSIVEVHVISDMHPKQKIADMLKMNDFYLPMQRIHSADYAKHGELCKAVLCDELGIDMLIDDFPGYVATGKHIRLLIMPDPHEPYYHDDWKTDGSEGDFGRRRKV